MYVTSSAVIELQPEKVAEKILEAIVKKAMKKDSLAVVACEVVIEKEAVIVGGEITTSANFNLEKIVRNTLLDLGFLDTSIGLNGYTCSVQAFVRFRSPDQTFEENKVLNLTKQEKMPLFERLVQYAEQDVTPFDVPGHKMGAKKSPLRKELGEKTLRMDVNSMKELDLLSHPKSVIKEAQELAAEAFGADHAFFLVNGTTTGIHAMILATTKPGDTIIVPRNCHKSVMNGLILSGARPAFIQPEVDYHFGISHGISLQNVVKALDENPEAKVILVTYPTYFGSLNSLKAICEIAHQRGVAVIVDSAHGAHLAFVPDLTDAIEAGADAVTVSMHKTGGSLTQSSLLLVKGERVSPESIQKSLNMLQTTSANYLLMSSLDVARRELVLNGKTNYSRLKPLVHDAINRIENGSRYEVLRPMYLNGTFNQSFDWTKLVIRVNGIGLTGFEVYSILKEKYGIQMELAEGYVIMAVITTHDSKDSLDKLVFALTDIAEKYGKESTLFSTHATVDQVNDLILSPRDAYYSDHESIPFEEAEGRISADSVMIYPPGIPLVIPGELITKDTILQFNYYSQTLGCVLTETREANHIKVVK